MCLSVRVCSLLGGRGGASRHLLAALSESMIAPCNLAGFRFHPEVFHSCSQATDWTNSRCRHSRWSQLAGSSCITDFFFFMLLTLSPHESFATYPTTAASSCAWNTTTPPVNIQGPGIIESGDFRGEGCFLLSKGQIFCFVGVTLNWVAQALTQSVRKSTKCVHLPALADMPLSRLCQAWPGRHLTVSCCFVNLVQCYS